MKMNEQKEVGLIKNFFNKCKYSLDGLDYCFKNESSFVIVTLTSSLIIVLGVIFDLSFMEWIASMGSMALVLIVELINTAIEATVDMVTSEYNPYAKIAKDCGSAATGIMGILAAIANMIIFFPYIIKWLISLF